MRYYLSLVYLKMMDYGIGSYSKKPKITNRENSEDILNYIVRQMKSLGFSKPFEYLITQEYLSMIFNPYKDYIKNKNGNDIEDVIRWLL